MDDIRKYEPMWGAWYVDSLIGEGTFGKVYKVRREEFGKKYYAAVKMITIPQNEVHLRQVLGEGMDEASVRSYFHAFVVDISQEIDLMSEFRGNSNIVSFEDHMVIEKTEEIGWDILIRMELLTSLPDYMMSKPMSREEITKLGIHICRALEICAIHSTIHRDIKPDNIFVSRYGEFKLGDFGIARQIERTTAGLSKKGTFTYMAPEVFRGLEYGSSVDTYSLGIVMYRLLSQNRSPFLPSYPALIKPSDHDIALQRRMAGEPVPPIKNISPELNAIVLRACAFDRRARFSSPTEMREALEAITDGKSFTPIAIATPAQSFTQNNAIPQSEDASGSAGSFANSAKIEERSTDRSSEAIPYKKSGAKPAVIAVSVAIAIAVVALIVMMVIKATTSSDPKNTPSFPYMTSSDLWTESPIESIDDNGSDTPKPTDAPPTTTASITDPPGAPSKVGNLTAEIFKIFKSGTYHAKMLFPEQKDVEVYQKGDSYDQYVWLYNNDTIGYFEIDGKHVISTRIVVKNSKRYIISNSNKKIYVQDYEEKPIDGIGFDTTKLTFISEGFGEFNGMTCKYDEYAVCDTNGKDTGERYLFFMDGDEFKGIRFKDSDGDNDDIVVYLFDTNVPDSVFDLPDYEIVDMPS